MLIVHGRYFWRRQIVAYRNDFCLSCAAARLALKHRTFDVFHVFWVPVLPLGFRRRWHCQVCGRDPHANPRTRRSFKWLGVGVLAFFSLLGWVLPPGTARQDAAFTWLLRLGGPLATAWAVWATVKGPAEVHLADSLRLVQPDVRVNCPVCQAPLHESESGWVCPRCGIRREVLPAG